MSNTTIVVVRFIKEERTADALLHSRMYGFVLYDIVWTLSILFTTKCLNIWHSLRQIEYSQLLQQQLVITL